MLADVPFEEPFRRNRPVDRPDTSAT